MSPLINCPIAGELRKRASQGTKRIQRGPILAITLSVPAALIACSPFRAEALVFSGARSLLWVDARMVPTVRFAAGKGSGTEREQVVRASLEWAIGNGVDATGHPDAVRRGESRAALIFVTTCLPARAERRVIRALDKRWPSVRSSSERLPGTREVWDRARKNRGVLLEVKSVRRARSTGEYQVRLRTYVSGKSGTHGLYRFRRQGERWIHAGTIMRGVT